jgi:quercetin dioxygenase-like cupin family protein
MNTESGTGEVERLRPHPTERFAGESHVLDLGALLASLRAEDHPARDGHRQIVVFRRGRVTQVLFAFDAHGALDTHSTNGLVTIHVLEGVLTVDAEGSDHDLSAGHVLVLDAGVPHAVRAGEAPGAMLLTVHLYDREG